MAKKKDLKDKGCQMCMVMAEAAGKEVPCIKDACPFEKTDLRGLRRQNLSSHPPNNSSPFVRAGKA